MSINASGVRSSVTAVTTSGPLTVDSSRTQANTREKGCVVPRPPRANAWAVSSHRAFTEGGVRWQQKEAAEMYKRGRSNDMGTPAHHTCAGGTPAHANACVPMSLQQSF